MRSFVNLQNNISLNAIYPHIKLYCFETVAIRSHQPVLYTEKQSEGTFSSCSRSIGWGNIVVI